MQHIVPISLNKILKSFFVLIILFLVTLFLANFLWGKIVNSYPFYLIDSFVKPNYKNITSSSFDRVNLLILGVGGGSHEGADLTDSMLFLSMPVDSNNKNLIRVSIPRDIWSVKYSTKINSLYHYGGFDMVSEGVEDVLGVRPDYLFLLDFSSFREVIDVLGGVTVNVSESFVDNKYPIEGLENDLCGGDPLYGCRYKTVSFEKGETFMNGETALIYARSRHSEGDTGTDFARGIRQQEVFDGIYKKIFSPEVISNSQVYFNLIKVISENVKSNVSNQNIPSILRLVFDSRAKVKSFSLEDYLYSPLNYKKYDNQYVLIPKTNNWNKLQSDLKNSF